MNEHEQQKTESVITPLHTEMLSFLKLCGKPENQNTPVCILIR